MGRHQRTSPTRPAARERFRCELGCHYPRRRGAAQSGWPPFEETTLVGVYPIDGAPSFRPDGGVVIEDVSSQTEGPANLILPSQPGPIHGIFEAKDHSRLRLPYPGVRARPGHRVEAVPHGSAARSALIPNPDEVLRVKGFVELTAHNCELFRAGIRADLNGHTSIEIDLSETIVMDCSGLGALIALRNLARRRNGVVRLMSPVPAVRRLLEIVRAEQIFEIVHTVGLDPIAHGHPGA
jgi:anti-anti-sigma factor